MIHKTIHFVTAVLLCCCVQKYGFGQSPDWQTNLEKVTPVSPTAASLSKFGNIPVNYFTGTPSINIPLLEARSGSLKVPVSLGYSYNGLKVEELASWVGLGWSLEAGGVISRTVRGTADEGINGYMNPSAPMKIKYMIDSIGSPYKSEEIKSYLRQAGRGLYDLEPDIFYFNLPGNSGKFYYNQEDDKFYTIPAQKINISRYGEGFLLISQDGTRSYFTAKEYSYSNPPQCTNTPGQAGSGGEFVATSWYLTKIENSTQTDSITFEYADTNYGFDNISSHSRYILFLMQGQHASDAGTPPDFNQQQCWQTSQISGKRLRYIRFREGYMKLTLASSARIDLPGDTALQRIEQFNLENKLIRRVSFEHDYFNASRLKLTKIKEEDADGNAIARPYVFTYEETGGLPHRLSYAQDHWGYYNGATANSDLIPTILYKDIYGNGRYLSGSDRKPNFVYAKLGALKQIAYPTGGSTEFEYENHEVKDTAIQPEFTWHVEHLEGDHNGGVQTQYSDTFEVNEPPNYYNFYNPQGGAYVDFSFIDIGCDLSGGASNCAILTVEGISPGTVGFGPFTKAVQGNYLRNGRYILKAVFNQNPPGYEDFYFSAQWRQPVLSNSNLVGGLRIKKITDYDSVNVGGKTVRSFIYASDRDSLSSGKVCGYPNSYQTDFRHEYYTTGYAGSSCAYYSLIRDYKKFTSKSNYPLVAHQGGYVAYEQVSVLYGENGENGKTVYNYGYVPDLIDDFPTVATSREWMRGLLLEEKHYKKAGQLYKLVVRDSIVYSGMGEYDNSLQNIAYGLKAGFKQSVTLNKQGCSIPLFWYQRENEASVPSLLEYETNTGFSPPVFKQSITYILDSYSSATEAYVYNPKNYLTKQIKILARNGDSIITKLKYSTDYIPVGDNPLWIKLLSDKKITSTPIEKIIIRKSPGAPAYVTGGTISILKSNRPVIDKVYVLELNEPLLLSSFTESYVDGNGNFIKDSRYKERVSFDKYDTYNNIIQQKKSDDINVSYIWDYNSSFPVAEVSYADSSSISYTSFESDGKGNWSFSGGVSPDATSPTGNKCYLLSGGNIVKGGLANRTYIVTYWSKNGSASVNGSGPLKTGRSKDSWTYYEHEVTATAVTVSGNTYIDELRLYPKDAQMTTFTYNPLIGMTSQCDAGNRIVYYEYDAFNRLSLIRDQNNNIIKKVCYNYAGQPEDCVPTININPSWQSTGQIRCKPCPSNAAYTTNMQQHEERDNNANSPSYNTTRWVDDNVPGSCTSSPAWQNTGTPVCQTSGGNNTGYVLQQQTDMNPCSPTYNQAQTVTTYNTTQCPPPAGCTTSTCTGDDKKCINGVCETGVWKVISSVRTGKKGSTQWSCTYAYCFSDGTFSIYRQTVFGTQSCFIECL